MSLAQEILSNVTWCNRCPYSSRPVTKGVVNSCNDWGKENCTYLLNVVKFIEWFNKVENKSKDLQELHDLIADIILKG